MTKKSTTIKTYFGYLRYATTCLSALLATWLFFQIFTESCGGPFPQRTRGPFAKPEYYQLSEMPAWENAIPLPGSDKNRAEILIEGQPIPPLEFQIPPDALQNMVKPQNPVAPATLQGSAD